MKSIFAHIVCSTGSVATDATGVLTGCRRHLGIQVRKQSPHYKTHLVGGVQEEKHKEDSLLFLLHLWTLTNFRRHHKDPTVFMKITNCAD